MTKIDKLIKRLLKVPSDFTYDELEKVFRSFGFSVGTKGKTSGSRVEFVSTELNVKFYLHKPHPQNTVKPYVIKQAIEFLNNLDLL